MQAILVEPEASVRDIYSLNISTQFGLEVISRQTVVETLDLLDILADNIKIIICNFSDDTQDSHQAILDFFHENNLFDKIGLFFLGVNDYKYIESVFFLSSNISCKDLVCEITSFINSESRTQQKEADSIKNKISFFPVPIGLFKYLDKIPCDSYIKINKSSEDKFLKRYSENDLVDFEEMLSYKEKGMAFLYVAKKDSEAITSTINEKFMNLIHGDLSHSATERQIREYVVTQLTDCGLNPIILKLADEVVEKTIDDFKDNGPLRIMLAEIYSNHHNFLYRYSLMTAFLGQTILKKTDWASATHIQNFILACFLNDTELQEEEHILVSSELELNESFFAPQIVDTISQHAKLSADKIKLINQIPSDVEKIVRQHHGSFTGIGYQSSLSGSISSLAKVFIASEELANQIIKSPRKKINIDELIRNINNKFNDRIIKEALVKVKQNFK